MFESTRKGRLARRGLALSLLICALLGVTAARAGAVPPRFYGLQFSNESQYGSAPEMEYIQRSGARYFRINISWGQVEGHGWGELDSLFGLAAARGITILPDLYGGRDGNAYPVAGEFAEWNAFVTGVIQRYGIGGTFWRGRPADPPPAWEVWNEPNLAANSPEETVDPTAYAEFLADTRTAIWAAEGPRPKPEVLLGGLFWNAGASAESDDAPGVEFLAGVLAAEAQLYGTEGSQFDGLGLHPYALSGPASGMVARVEEEVEGARAALDAFPGGAAKGIWITELGWPVGPAEGPITELDEAQQAELLSQSFAWLGENADALGIESALWYNATDAGSPPGWPERCGLRSEAGTYHLAYQAFVERTGAAPWTSPPAAVEDGHGDWHVFVDTVQGIEEYSRGAGGAWTEQVVAVGSFTSRPIAFVGPNGYVDVFATTATAIDRYVQAPGGAGWSAEVVGLGSFTSPPSAFVDGSGFVHLFVTEASGLQQYVEPPGGAWSSETVATATEFAATAVSHFRPAALVAPDGTVHVYITLPQGVVAYERAPGAPGWTPETVAPGSFDSAPSATLDPAGTQHVVVGGLTAVDQFEKPVGGGWAGEAVAAAPFAYGSAPASVLGVGGAPRVYAANAAAVTGYAVPGAGGRQAEALDAAGALGPVTSEPVPVRSASGTESVFVDTLGGIELYFGSAASGWHREVVAGG